MFAKIKEICQQYRQDYYNLKAINSGLENSKTIKEKGDDISDGH